MRLESGYIFFKTLFVGARAWQAQTDPTRRLLDKILEAAAGRCQGQLQLGIHRSQDRSQKDLFDVLEGQ